MTNLRESKEQWIQLRNEMRHKRCDLLTIKAKSLRIAGSIAKQSLSRRARMDSSFPVVMRLPQMVKMNSSPAPQIV